MKLRPYQERVIQELRQGLLEGHTRQILALATGAGKTVVAAHIVRSAVEKRHRCLFVVERIVLVDQAMKHLEAVGLKVGILQGENTNYTPDDEVIVASVQTLARRRPLDNIDVVFIDEVHILHKAHKNLMRL